MFYPLKIRRSADFQGAFALRVQISYMDEQKARTV